MEYTVDLDNVRVRGDKVGSIVSSYLKESYPEKIVNVECLPITHWWRHSIEFDFIIDIDYGNNGWPNSFYNRTTRKEVSNLCKYILGEHESLGNVHFNSVIHGVV